MKERDRVSTHLSKDLLVRALDCELAAAEERAARDHLSVCAECKQAYADLQRLSVEIEILVAATPAADNFSDRRNLARQLEAAHIGSSETAVVNPGAVDAGMVLRRFGWGMAIAATLAVGIMLAPHSREKTGTVTSAATAAQSATLEVDDESFIPLPYSNPDLPVNTSRIVQMQVPVSSLTEAGIVFEPVANGTLTATADRTVLADVLVGTDGQPLGVHILGVE